MVLISWDYKIQDPVLIMIGDLWVLLKHCMFFLICLWPNWREAWALHFNYCWLRARDVINIKDQLKPARLSRGFNTKHTPSATNPQPVLIWSLCTHSSKGQELLMARMTAEMAMKTAETELPSFLATLSHSFLLRSFCVSTSSNDQKAIKLQTRE